MQYIALNNGIAMPSIGLGTYELCGQKGVKIMQNALQIGYRLFDTAQMYKNEKELGIAIAQSPQHLQRNDLFITTKLSSSMPYKKAWQSIEGSLQNLGLEYVDLLVIHEPYANAKEMYQACEEAYRKGLTRTIEVLNFYGRYFRGFFRFWLDKGLFPFVERDENGVRYFAKSDIGWVDCLRSCNMSIKDIKHYINLTTGGMKTAKERKELLERHFKILSKELEILHIAHKKWK